jgi:hypothetical protein
MHGKFSSKHPFSEKVLLQCFLKWSKYEFFSWTPFLNWFFPERSNLDWNRPKQLGQSWQHCLWGCARGVWHEDIWDVIHECVDKHHVSQRGQCILFSVVFTPSPSSHWVLTCLSLLLTNTVSLVRACLSMCWERFRGTHRLNMEVNLQSLFGLQVTWCAQLYSLAETTHPHQSPAFGLVDEGAIGQPR